MVPDTADKSAKRLLQPVSARYQLHMPTEEQLQQEIQREKALLESLREKQS